MLDQAAVEKWLAKFVQALRNEFGERLVYVGHHGSWARGEGRPDSDIDTTVVVDRVEPADVDACRLIVEAMPDAQTVASGVLLSTDELRRWNPGELVQFVHGRKVLHGSVDAVVRPPTASELIEDVRRKACDNLIAARHYLIYPHDRAQAVHKLKYPFKFCFFALQAWILAQEGRFIERKEDLLAALNDPLDRAVVEVARDWDKSERNRAERPLLYMELLERWSSNMLKRLPARAC
jgi:predicted nucleotidyltransferase